MSAPSVFRDNVWMSVTGTPGTGAVTLNIALIGYQTAAAAGVADGETNTWKFVDNAGAWEISSCVYTASGTSLARTLIESSTGSLINLTSGATCFITADGADLQSSYASDLQFFGDKSDGNVTISGAVTLTRDMFYDTLTIAAGAALNPAGYRIFANVLDLSAAPAGGIAANGGAASGRTGGTFAGNNNTPLGGDIGGISGTVGGTGAGSAPSFGNPYSAGLGYIPGVAGGIAGASGASGTGNAGASSAAFVAPTATFAAQFLAVSYSTPGLTSIQGAAGGCGGPSGGGSAASTAGFGGGSGAGGFRMFIAARTVIRGAGTAAGAIQCKGGAGGNAANGAGTNSGGGGGGGGGPGGELAFIFRVLQGTAVSNLLDVTGGNGGDGGNGVGSGVGGDGGYSGTSGYIVKFDLFRGTLTTNAIAASVAGNAHSSGTKGTGATATATQMAV